MRASLARLLCLIAMMLSLVAASAAQSPAAIQFFLPGGALPARELKVTFLDPRGEKIGAKSDTRGLVRFPLEAIRGGLLTVQVEGDRVSFDTTILQIRPEAGASPLPIFLTPLESADFRPLPNAPDVDAYDAKVPAEARAARESAIKATNERSLPRAIAEFARALTIHPQYLRAINEYGMLQFQRGRLDEAAAAFIQAASLRSRFLFPRLNLALTRIRQERRGDAGIVLQSLLVDFPAFSRARIHYADLLFTGQQMDQAAEEFRLLTADASLEPDKRADAHQKLGIIRQREERYNAAIKEYQQALALGKTWPGEAQTRLFLGGALKEAKRLDEAEQEFLKAYAIGGKRALIVQKYLGQIYAEQKKYDQALKAYALYLEDTADPRESAAIREAIEKVKKMMNGG